MGIKHLDTFSGYGGFTLGVGSDTLGFSEIEPHAIAVLKYHYPQIKNYGSITEINPNDLPDFDLLTGGSPCQDLSVAGKQAGLSGSRSGLFFQFIRLLKEKQPTNFIWENVEGTLSSQDGWDFAKVQIEMAEAGYAFQWQILNAAEFGVPQSRKRIYVVGHFGAGCPREIFFKERSGRVYLKEITQGVSDAQRIYSANGVARTLKALGGGQGAKTGLYAVLTPNRLEKRQNGRRMKNDGEPMFTLTAQDRHGIYDGVRIRMLTPKECERLMGLTDDWTRWGVKPDGTQYELSDSARYKLCGNGVVVNVVKEIVNLLYENLAHN